MKKAPGAWIVPQQLLPLAVLAALALLAAMASPAACAQQRPMRAIATTIGAEPRISPEDEQAIVRMVNQERQARGLATLRTDAGLIEAARLHSRRMVTEHKVEHGFAGEPHLSLRLGEQKLRFDQSGENVALAATAERVHDALMHSPGHRANILDGGFNAIGIGVVQTPEGLYVTEDFARLVPESSVDEVEEQVGQQLNRLRRAAKAPELRQLPAPGLREKACAMARANRLDPSAAMSARIGGAVAFTVIDLNRLADPLRRLQSTEASAFSVAACYQSSTTYENPVYWVLVVTYF